MSHTIIIPYHERKQYLDLCIRSIVRSARECRVEDYEILVVEYAWGAARPKDKRIKRTTVWPPERPFNKSRLLNLGLEKAEGQYVSILDCDMLVGSRWMEAYATFEAAPSLKRIAYRVRQLTAFDTKQIMDGTCPQMFFEQYNDPGAFGPGGDYPGRFGRGWEGYGDPERNVVDKTLKPWGNSQFTMRRSDLEGLWYDEGQVGKGWEDIDFNRQIERRFRGGFVCGIFIDGDHALLHMHHERPESWDSGDIREANLKRYRERWAE